MAVRQSLINSTQWPDYSTFCPIIITVGASDIPMLQRLRAEQAWPNQASVADSSKRGLLKQAWPDASHLAPWRLHALRMGLWIRPLRANTFPVLFTPTAFGFEQIRRPMRTEIDWVGNAEPVNVTTPTMRPRQRASSHYALIRDAHPSTSNVTHMLARDLCVAVSKYCTRPFGHGQEISALVARHSVAPRNGGYSASWSGDIRHRGPPFGRAARRRLCNVRSGRSRQVWPDRA
jgi:hypothetical protein